MNIQIISTNTKRRTAQVVVHTTVDGVINRHGKPYVWSQTRHVPLTTAGKPDLSHIAQPAQEVTS